MQCNNPATASAQQPYRHTFAAQALIFLLSPPHPLKIEHLGYIAQIGHQYTSTRGFHQLTRRGGRYSTQPLEPF